MEISVKKIFVLTCVLLSSLLTVNAAKPELTIYTYDSFTSDWGPGPLVKSAFEGRCGCQLTLVGLEDGVSLLNRIKLEGKHSKADLVLGIDTNLTAEARKTGLFEAHELEFQNSVLPSKWTDDVFLPYDFGYFAFVYNHEKLKAPPQSLRELAEDLNGPTILIQDPRTSTPGLGLLLWMKKVFGDKSDDAWKKLAPRIVTVSKGWSEAYGLFLKDEAQMVLSYSTSPAYHLIAEQDDRYRAAEFLEGHYQQIEVAGILKSSQQKELARRFLKFMNSHDFQSIIPTTNWMYPAALPAEQLPQGYESLNIPSKALIFDEATVAKNRKAWVNEWLDVIIE
ncbi:MAG: thiamine transport system substrate-binding protein [Gammaproteobacteria bacterium]|jgi:thiamine transport system substrate-binding protein